MNNIKFSIIVPVYNTQKYLKKCINSIIHQTYDNFEVILVNDGSTDNSEQIIKNFAKKSDKITLITQSNAGANSARKNGFKHADGDYILFVDSDDWINKNTLEHCFNIIKEHNADIIQYRYTVVLGPFRNKPKKSENVIFNHNEFMNKYIYGLAGGAGTLTRGITKVYRKSIVEKALFEHNYHFKICEDAYMNLLAFTQPDAQKNILLNEPLYFYRHGSGVTSNTDQIKLYTECMKTKAAIYDLLVENNINTFILGVCVSENAGKTRYYLAYRFKNCLNNDEKEKIYKETMNLPAVIQAVEYAKAHPEWINKSNVFLTYDFNACKEYIEANAEQELKQSLTIKIKLLLHKILGGKKI